MKRNLVRLFLMFIVPIAFCIGSKYGLSAAGRLTNIVLKYKFNVQSALPLYITGAMGLIVLILILYGMYIIMKIFWGKTGEIMDWYDREQGRRERVRARERRIEGYEEEDRERNFRAALREGINRIVPGGEALRHPVEPHPIHSPRSDTIANLLHQQRLRREEEEELNEDRAYRERIGVE